MLLLTPPLMTSRMEANCSAFVVVIFFIPSFDSGKVLIRREEERHGAEPVPGGRCAEAGDRRCSPRLDGASDCPRCEPWKAHGIHLAGRTDIDAVAQVGGRRVVAIAEVLNAG